MLSPIHSDFKVANESLFETRCTVARVKEEHYLLTGVWCSDAQALAATLSVPNGAPVAMTEINIGPLPDEYQVAWFEGKRAATHAYTKVR